MGFIEARNTLDIEAAFQVNNPNVYSQNDTASNHETNQRTSQSHIKRSPTNSGRNPKSGYHPKTKFDFADVQAKNICHGFSFGD